MMDVVMSWLAQRDTSDWVLLWALGGMAFSVTQIAVLRNQDASALMCRVVAWIDAKTWAWRRKAIPITPIIVGMVVFWPATIVVMGICRPRRTRKEN